MAFKDSINITSIQVLLLCGLFDSYKMVVKNLATAAMYSCQQMKSVNSTTTKTKSFVSISIYLLLVFMRYFVKWKCNCVMYASLYG